MVLDVIVINDKKAGTFTAYLKKFPGVVIQVDDKKDIKPKLDKVFRVFIKMVQKQHDFRLTESELV